MNRKFYGNQYIGKTWRTFKLVLSGTWIGIKEIVRNPGKVTLAVLMLGLALNTFIQLAPSHVAVLIVQDAWADLKTDEAYVASTTVVILKDPVKVLEIVASCESGETAGVTPGRQFDKNGVLIIGRASKDGSLDIGKHQINRERHERKARALGMDIYTEEGNTEYARHLYDAEGLTPWNPSRDCWNNKI